MQGQVSSGMSLWVSVSRWVSAGWVCQSESLNERQVSASNSGVWVRVKKKVSVCQSECVHVCAHTAKHSGLKIHPPPPPPATHTHGGFRAKFSQWTEWVFGWVIVKVSMSEWQSMRTQRQACTSIHHPTFEDLGQNVLFLLSLLL